MRIGILTLDWPPHGGGMSRFCSESCAELARRGHRLTVLSWHRAAGGGEGARVEPVLNGDLSTDQEALRRFDRDVDLWHAWEFGYGGLAHLTSRPMVVTVHGNDLMRPKAYYRFTRTPFLHRFASRLSKPSWQTRLCRAGLGRVACFTPNSANTGRLLRRAFPACRRVEVVPCGVSDRFFQPHEGHDGPPRLLTVCSLSRLRQRKNVAGVLRGLAKLKNEFGFQYDIVGDGDMIDELRAMTTRLGLDDRVRLHGAVNDERLAEFYRTADLFVLAPYERKDDVEGFGIVYLEANAAGTPCLAVRTGGIEDAVRDGVNGFFSASPEPAALADALRGFLSGEIHLDREAVRDWADRHRYPCIVDRLEAVYQRVADSQAGAECIHGAAEW